MQLFLHFFLNLLCLFISVLRSPKLQFLIIQSYQNYLNNQIVNHFINNSMAAKPPIHLFSFIYQSLHNGIVNLKSLPFPTTLSTQIFPLCFSTKSLQRINPKPVPVSPLVPFFEK